MLDSLRRFIPAIVAGIIICAVLAMLLLYGCNKRKSDEKIGEPLTVAPRVVSQTWTPTERKRVKQILDMHFAPLLASKQNGFVLLASDGSILYDHNGSAPRTPASTLKVLTAATALRVLGADYRFVTRMAAVSPIEAGVLDSDLYIIGGGDPMLVNNELRQGVKALKAMGLTRILGHVVVDTTAFVGPEQNPHWAPDDLNLDYAAGTSAVSLDGNIQIFRVIPGAPGQAAQIRLEPSNREAVLRGSILTVGSGSQATVHIDHVAGRNEFRLSGSIVAGAEQRFPIPVGNVGAYIGGVVDTMLAGQKIPVLTPALVDAAPLGATELWKHASIPLREIVHHMLVVSDNHLAEQLLRTIAAASGHKGTEAEGVKVEAEFLTKLGVTDRGLRLYDGSGLSPGDRIAPRSLAAVIADALGTPGSPLIFGLPRVGIEGTVRGHTLKASRGRVRAKSGHITGVDGLAGVIQTHRHGTLTFAFLMNDGDDATVEDAEDAIFDELMKY